jgi:distribution and morphology protein 31
MPRVYRRTKSSKSYNGRAEATEVHQKKPNATESDPKPESTKPTGAESPVSKYFHLPAMPHLPHRPTKEEFLAAANGFWERLKVRFKWASIRSMRPWNIDEWGAFVSWFLFGHLVWILVGTTTFFSLVILSINTVVAQGQCDYMLSAFTTLTFLRNACPMGRGLLNRICWTDRYF